MNRPGRLLKGLSQRTLKRRLRGRSLESTRRHGKILFVGLDDDHGALVLHFGMTGFLRYYRNVDSAPDHARVVLDLDDGYHLAYDSQRLFGEVGFAPDVDEWIEDHHLGPDALEMDADALVERLSARRGSLKSALMDQGLLAGIGNVYSDEILFRAHLDPRTAVGHLEERELRSLHKDIEAVLETAIRHQADPNRVPRTWLLPRREEGARCPRCEGKLKRVRVNQRSAWLCPSCQERR